MTDYISKVHNIYASAFYRPTDKLRLFARVNYNNALAGLEAVIMPDIEARLGGDLENQTFEFEEMPTYSDLDYTMIRISGGFAYDLSPDVTFSVDADYSDLTDDKGYIFGIESGSYFMIRSGFKIGF